MIPQPLLPLIDSSLITRLHRGHAAYLQEYFTGANREVIAMGDTRAFLSERGEKTGFKRRIILNGDEGPEVIDRILAGYERYGTACIAEINPANFYVDGEDKNALTKYLASKGFFAGEFRAVWFTSTENSPQIDLPKTVVVRRFDAGELDEFLADVVEIEGDAAASADEIRRSEAGQRWLHYIAYVDAVPAATSTLMLTDDTGYLAWSYTAEKYRQRGLQGALIRQRVQDARDRHCDLAFSVTSFNVHAPGICSAMGCDSHTTMCYL